jgi:hypothetical protein
VARETLVCAGPKIAEVIDFDDLWTALGQGGDAHMRRIQKFMQDDAEPFASFNASI